MPDALFPAPLFGAAALILLFALPVVGAQLTFQVAVPLLIVTIPDRLIVAPSVFDLRASPVISPDDLTFVPSQSLHVMSFAAPTTNMTSDVISHVPAARVIEGPSAKLFDVAMATSADR